MDIRSETPQPELRISSLAVVLALAALSVAMIAGAQVQRTPRLWSRFLDLGLVMGGAALAGWLLTIVQPLAAKWWLVTTSLGTVILSARWLDLPSILFLLQVPVLLSAALIGLVAATATALSETLVLAFWPRLLHVGLDAPHLAIALAGIWVVLATLIAIYRPIYVLGGWMQRYLDSAEQVVEQARDRKAQLEQALADLSNANRQLALANERIGSLRTIAEEAQQAKMMFVAKVSHELRTPLNMIIGLVGLLLDETRSKAHRIPAHILDDLKVVYRNCEHLAAMISDVLDLSQIEAGRLTLHRTWVDLGEVVESAAAVVRPLLEKKGVALLTNLPARLPPVYCDRTRIRQVILNLLSNAARFTDEGVVSVDVTLEEPHITVEVSDTGPGIAPEDARHIFEPFRSALGYPWQERSGSGLGLSISKEFVELHGGRMWLESEPGLGSSFFFELPITPAAERRAEAWRTVRPEWIWRERAFRTDRTVTAADLVRPRLIICDESGELQREFARCAPEAEMIGAGDVDQAIAALAECPAHALVVNAPAPDELWRLASAVAPSAPQTPTIVCALSRGLPQAVQEGALGHLVKPVLPSDLNAALHSPAAGVQCVLVVDDDEDVLHLFQRMLSSLEPGLKVLTATNGAQALRHMHRHAPDLVLLDIIMPGLDGWQVLQRKQQDPHIRHIPVYVVSAQDPNTQPLSTPALLVALGHGVSPAQLASCVLGIPRLLMERPPARSPAPQ